ncbi:MAG: chorismate-binding protein [Flavobacteriaceae bacterium]|nr:chorismate-binding protein [Flavobacteriaceae bacterium]
MSKLLNKIYESIANGSPFVAYRKPNQEQVKLVIKNDDRLHTVTDYTESGFILAPFDSEQTAVIIPFDEVVNEKVNPIPIAITSEVFPEISPESKIQYEKLVQKGIDAIHDKHYDKVVLSRVHETELKDITIPELYHKLLSNYPTAFVYVFSHPKVGCWLGATPEKLIQIDGKVGKTMALAGTQPFSDDIKWEQKEEEEQQFVTDFIVDTLANIGATSRTSDVYTVQAGNLAHLRTDINFHLGKEVALKQVLEALHPTPAVSGLPKETSKAFILDHEGYERAFYTGFLGELNIQNERSRNKRNTENKAYNFNKNSSDLYVNLRCMQLQNEKVFIYTGGGITKDSIPEKEYEETVNKSLTILRVLSS